MSLYTLAWSPFRYGHYNCSLASTSTISASIILSSTGDANAAKRTMNSRAKFGLRVTDEKKNLLAELWFPFRTQQHRIHLACQTQVDADCLRACVPAWLSGCLARRWPSIWKPTTKTNVQPTSKMPKSGRCIAWKWAQMEKASALLKRGHLPSRWSLFPVLAASRSHLRRDLFGLVVQVALTSCDFSKKGQKAKEKKKIPFVIPKLPYPCKLLHFSLILIIIIIIPFQFTNCSFWSSE